MEHAFGGCTNNLESADQCTHQTKRHSAQVAYICAAASHGKENNLFDRKSSSTPPRTVTMISLCDWTMSSAKAAQLGKKAVATSAPEIGQQTSRSFEIWRRCLQKLLSAIRNDPLSRLLPTLQTTLAEANINTPFPQTLLDSQPSLSQARTDIKQHCTTPNTSRANALSEKIAQERDSLNLSKAKSLERIASDELRDNTFQIFRAVRGETQGPDLTVCKYLRQGQLRMIPLMMNGPTPKPGTKNKNHSAS
jgi:hypothetical protein